MLDLTSGRFAVQQLDGVEELSSELERLRPAELLLAEDYSLPVQGQQGITRRPEWHFDLDSATRLLCSQFGTRDLKGFECDPYPRAVAAAGALLSYVTDTQKTATPQPGGWLAAAQLQQAQQHVQYLSAAKAELAFAARGEAQGTRLFSSTGWCTAR